jgi:hypothetical protein
MIPNPNHRTPEQARIIFLLTGAPGLCVLLVFVIVKLVEAVR